MDISHTVEPLPAAILGIWLARQSCALERRKLKRGFEKSVGENVG